MKLTGKSVLVVGLLAMSAVSAFAQAVISAKSGTIALVGHVITRRNATESQRLLKQQHDNTTVEWARQHDQWRADYDVLQKRWFREQTFTLIDQAVTRCLERPGGCSDPYLGVSYESW